MMFMKTEALLLFALLMASRSALAAGVATDAPTATSATPPPAATAPAVIRPKHKHHKRRNAGTADYAPTAVTAAYPSTAAAGATSRQAPAIDITAAWFKPALLTNNDPNCDTALSDVTDTFASTGSAYDGLSSFKSVPGPYARNELSDPKVQAFKDDPRQYELTLPGGTNVFLYFMELTGCGGACDAEELLVSDSRLVNPDWNTPAPSATPQSDGWALQEDSKGNFYAVGVVDGDLQVYRLSDPKNWTLSCVVSLQPDLSQKGISPAVDQAQASIGALTTAVEGMSEGWGYGACGSSQAPARMQGDARAALQEALYRPWAITKDIPEIASENSYLDYPRIYESLKLWSLGGVFEYRTFERYESQLAQTKKELAAFYAQNFHMNEDRAASLAQDVTVNAVAHAFAFYMYDPYPYDAVLRRAILEHHEMGEIQEIGFGPSETEGPPNADTVLDAAVAYPEALSYLLKQGANPNHANGFGKTPLMYAAQYDQLESAKLLLAAGADPNATTTVPTDECSYDIHVVHVTALHYAARYASVAFIKLLLDDHARPYSQAEEAGYRQAGNAGEYPLDWLRRYAGPAAGAERNPNIASSEFDAVAGMLKVGDGSELAHTAATMVAKAEADYAGGRTKEAYSELTAALAAQPDNTKAIADMPLVALKAGQLGPAMVAANRALATFKDPPSLAAAWFNKGLICDRPEARHLTYDGNHCDTDTISPFLKAWQQQSTPAMARGLKSVFAPGKPGVCEVAKPDPAKGTLGMTAVVGFNFSTGEQIYVYHSAKDAVSPFDISWFVPQRGKKIAKFVEDVPLGDDVISVFSGDLNLPPTIDGQTCNTTY